MRKSLLLFVRGIVSRFWFWVPGGLLVGIDFYERYIRPRLPGWPSLVVPAEYGLYLLAAGLVWAAFLTFHEVRTQLEAANRQLDERGDRKMARESIELVIGSGNALLRAMHNEIDVTSTEAPWRKRYDDWYTEAQHALSRNQFTSHTLGSFQTPLTFMAAETLGKPEWATALLNQLSSRIGSLVEIQRGI